MMVCLLIKATSDKLILQRGLPHNVTTEMDLKLWQVAKVIQKDALSYNHFLDVDASVLSTEYLGKLLPERAQRVIEQFLKEYGMRGLYEIDFGRPRWREDPTPLMQTLKTYIDIPEENAPDKVFAAGELAAENAISKLSVDLNKPWLVPFLARRVRAIAGMRELPKFTIIRCMGVIRGKILQEGEHLVKKGVISDAKDLFLLYDEEIFALTKGTLENYRELIAERRREMEAENSRKRIPRVIASDGFAYFGGAVRRADVLWRASITRRI